jgi:hypothetical protein
MAKTPPDLSSAWWKKNKPSTLKKTGTGDALVTLEKCRVPCDGKEPAGSHWAALTSAFDAVEKGFKAADAACLPVVHKDWKDALKAYFQLLKDARKRYQDLKAKHDAETKKLMEEMLAKDRAARPLVDKIDAARKVVLAQTKEVGNLAPVVKQLKAFREGLGTNADQQQWNKYNETAKTLWVKIASIEKQVDDAIKAAALPAGFVLEDSRTVTSGVDQLKRHKEDFDKAIRDVNLLVPREMV